MNKMVALGSRFNRRLLVVGMGIKRKLQIILVYDYNGEIGLVIRYHRSCNFLNLEVVRMLF